MEDVAGTSSKEIMTFWEGKRVFVTGATGLLGSHLTLELLKRGAQVTVLVFDEPTGSLLVQSPAWRSINKVHGKLQDFTLLHRAMNEYDIEYVFHLGAQTIVTHANDDPLETMESNIRGTYNLLEACRLHDVKGVVIASSDKAYGAHEKLPYTEDAPLRGSHPYDVSKSCADLIAQAYYHSYKLPVCVVRCANLYGMGDMHFSRIVPVAIAACVEDKSVELRSDGKFVRDYLYVGDAVEGYLFVAEQMHRDDVVGQAFNLGTDSRLSVVEIVGAVNKAAGSSHAPVILDSAEREIRVQYLSSEKAKRLLGWRSRHTIEQGLAKTVPGYKKFLESRRWS